MWKYIALGLGSLSIGLLVGKVVASKRAKKKYEADLARIQAAYNQAATTTPEVVSTPTVSSPNVAPASGSVLTQTTIASTGATK